MSQPSTLTKAFVRAHTCVFHWCPWVIPRCSILSTEKSEDGFRGRQKTGDRGPAIGQEGVGMS